MRSCQATVKGGDGHHELACVLTALLPSTGTAAANVPAVGPATTDAEPINAPSAAAPSEPSFEAEPPANEYRNSGGGAQASGDAAALALGATDGDADAELDLVAAALGDGEGDGDCEADGESLALADGDCEIVKSEDDGDELAVSDGDACDELGDDDGDSEAATVGEPLGD